MDYSNYKFRKYNPEEETMFLKEYLGVHVPDEKDKCASTISDIIHETMHKYNIKKFSGYFNVYDDGEIILDGTYSLNELRCFVEISEKIENAYKRRNFEKTYSVDSKPVL